METLLLSVAWATVAVFWYVQVAAISVPNKLVMMANVAPSCGMLINSAALLGVFTEVYGQWALLSTLLLAGGANFIYAYWNARTELEAMELLQHNLRHWKKVAAVVGVLLIVTIVSTTPSLRKQATEKVPTITTVNKLDSLDKLSR